MEQGRSGRVRHMEFQEWNQGLKLEWRIESKEYEVREQKWNKGGIGIGVPVWGCTECNSKLTRWMNG